MARIRVATYNALSGRRPGAGLGQLPDPAELASSVAALDADVVALQEIDRLLPRSGTRDQVADLLAALSRPGEVWTGRLLPTLWGEPGLTRSWTAADGDGDPGSSRPAYGIALLTRLPVRAWSARRMTSSWGRIPMLLPTPSGRVVPLLVPDEPRAALAALLDTPVGPLSVVSTHLSFLPPRAIRQLRGLSRWALQLPGPRLLMGDLNLPGPVPARLTGWAALASRPTFPAHAPRVQLDHVLGHQLGHQPRHEPGDRPSGQPGDQPSRLRADSSYTVAGVVSDHRALVVDLVND